MMILRALLVRPSQHDISTVVQRKGHGRFVVDLVINLGIEVVKGVPRHVPFLLTVVDSDPFRQKKEIKQRGAKSYAIGSTAVIRHWPRYIDFGGYYTDIHRPFHLFLISVSCPDIQDRGKASPVGRGPGTFIKIHVTDQTGIEQGYKTGRVVDIE